MEDNDINRIVIAEDADLTLLVNGMEIYVSSQEMTKSKVFRAMLSPNFSEGQSFLNNKGEKPVTISLPDDDEDDALAALCSMLHGDQEYRQYLFSNSSCLLSFANLVDKYDCLSFVTPDQPMYLLDDSEGFKKYTRHLVMDFDYDARENYTDNELSLEIYEAICDRENQSKTHLFGMVDAAVQFLLQHTTPNQPNARKSCDLSWLRELDYRGECSRYAQRCAARYLQAFKAMQLWPSAEHRTDPVGSLLERAKDVKVDMRDLVDACIDDFGHLNYDLYRFISNLSDSLDQQLAELRVTGLCLNCFKQSPNVILAHHQCEQESV